MVLIYDYGGHVSAVPQRHPLSFLHSIHTRTCGLALQVERPASKREIVTIAWHADLWRILWLQ